MPGIKQPATRPAGKRNAFVRTNVPLSERVISIVIVCLLAGIGIAIWQAGKHFDPNLYSLRTDALKSTASTVEGKSGTLRTETTAQAGEEMADKPQAGTGEPSAENTKPAESGEAGGGEGAGDELEIEGSRGVGGD